MWPAAPRTRPCRRSGGGTSRHVQPQRLGPADAGRDGRKHGGCHGNPSCLPHRFTTGFFSRALGGADAEPPAEQRPEPFPCTVQAGRGGGVNQKAAVGGLVELPSAQDHLRGLACLQRMLRPRPGSAASTCRERLRQFRGRADVGSARNARTSRRPRPVSSTSTSRVGPLPTRSHTTFGGGPRVADSRTKSASLDVTASLWEAEQARHLARSSAPAKLRRAARARTREPPPASIAGSRRDRFWSNRRLTRRVSAAGLRQRPSKPGRLRRSVRGSRRATHRRSSRRRGTPGTFAVDGVSAFRGWHGWPLSFGPARR